MKKFLLLVFTLLFLSSSADAATLKDLLHSKKPLRLNCTLKKASIIINDKITDIPPHVGKITNVNVSI
jgi:hypothetical protein|tara:strand:+ start:116 stop:319 length:204 start_codon:yes stop_codon:yes gene_type:complete